MTRKDYVAFAVKLSIGAPFSNNQAENARLVCIDRIADVFEADNPRFDRKGFLLAAGWPSITDGKTTNVRFVALER